MLLFLEVLILLALIYVALRTTQLAKNQEVIVAFLENTVKFLEAKLKEIKDIQTEAKARLAYGWWDKGWPIAKCDEEDRAPIENPTPGHFADDYATRMYILEYKSKATATQRKEFLMQMRDECVWMAPELLDVIYADNDAFVRAWAAGHLETAYSAYADSENPREVRNYELALLQDTEPVVRAALWSNPRCNSLPWNRYAMSVVSEGWKDHLQSISQLERLGLMRNPELESPYIVALLETPSEELNITRKEHAEVLCAAAVNPTLIGGSRSTGRRDWIGGGEGNPPFKEYGTMWTLSLGKWSDEYLVPYLFFKYIQTTPEVKIAVYTRLLEKTEDSEYKGLRVEVIRSCDPYIDESVLKLALADPDESCLKIARERVGEHGTTRA